MLVSYILLLLWKFLLNAVLVKMKDDWYWISVRDQSHLVIRNLSVHTTFRGIQSLLPWENHGEVLNKDPLRKFGMGFSMGQLYFWAQSQVWVVITFSNGRWLYYPSHDIHPHEDGATYATNPFDPHCNLV